MKRLSVIFLIMALVFGLFGAALAEEVILEGEELLGFFKSTEEDFSNPDYVGCERIYINSDGEIKKFASNLINIDGYVGEKEVDINNKIIGGLNASSEEEYPFEGDYYYLYYNTVTGFMRPIKSEELELDINGIRWKRTKFVTSINEEILKILNETDTYRVTDNIVILDSSVVYIQDKTGWAGLSVLEPIELTSDELITKYTAIIDTINPYEEKYNGYLINVEHNLAPHNYMNATEEERTIVLKRNRQ